MPVIGYRFGQVTYQHAALARMVHPVGAPAITINGNPSTHISLINTDILRKRPVHPFIDQDEWRIAIYTDGYANQDPSLPLRIQVDPGHFYPYLTPESVWPA
ncbi:MAG: hypothetical protein WAT39_07270 [Planctomycetota bacterium]